ncbi:sensor histidine kinase [Pedobacter rhizosphaerae]|uniref:Histidine kinase n=1 Tax=Pedobacter rhizosphaerae TaxID=390241 RepID=A0A1H9PKT1_9SPHI|nr:sensor histidine kinase [Pedobacter rhizosphaerae]SER48778.1 Histidine kinase [Pedobacter rhizosphaerae]
MFEKIKKYRYHILAWSIFIAYETVLVTLMFGIKANPLKYAMHYLINIGLFYLHSELILPFSLKKESRSYWRLLLLILSSLLVYVLLAHLADAAVAFYHSPDKGLNLNLHIRNISSTLYRGIYFLLFSTAYYFTRAYILEKQQSAALREVADRMTIAGKEAEIELSAARNAYLKSQISPHFLFNTLNYIHNNIYKSDPQSAEALRILSRLTRYAIESEHGPEKKALGEEIEQVELLLTLSQIKHTELYVDFNYEPEIAAVEIIPLVLLSLVENMIKHGNLSIAQFPGKILMEITADRFHLRTENLINTGINDTGFHTGLKNIQQRLMHTYGDKASIAYGTSDIRFTVDVVIEEISQTSER